MRMRVRARVRGENEGESEGDNECKEVGQSGRDTGVKGMGMGLCRYARKLDRNGMVEGDD